MRKPKYVGLSEKCNGPSFAAHKESFKKDPHDGEHDQLMSYKSFEQDHIIKLKYFYGNFKDLNQKMNENIEKLIYFLKDLKKFSNKNIEDSFYSSIHKDGVNESKFHEIASHLIDPNESDNESESDEEEKELTCSNLFHFLANVNRNQKPEDIDKSIDNIKGQISKQINEKIRELFPEPLVNFLPFQVEESEIAPKRVSKKQKSEQIFHNFQSFNRNEKQNQGQNLQILISDNERSQSWGKNKVFKKRKNEQIEQKRQNSKDKDKNKNKIKEKSKNDKNSTGDKNISSFGSEIMEPILRDLSAAKTPKRRRGHSPRTPKAKLKQKNGARLYKVNELLNKSMNRNNFSIKVKIIKQVMLRTFRDENSNRNYNKLKFIGGDETGIIVCYVDLRDYMKIGETILLHKCELGKFNGTSYEIKSDYSDQLEGGDEAGIGQIDMNKVLYLSNFEQKQKLIYNDQRYDRFWKTIRGIASAPQWEHKNTKTIKELSLIAEITEISHYEKDEHIFYLTLADCTGSIEAKIKNRSFGKYKAARLRVGQVILMNEVIAERKISHDEWSPDEVQIMLTNCHEASSYSFVPKVISGMQFEELSEEKAVDIYMDYYGDSNITK